MVTLVQKKAIEQYEKASKLSFKKYPSLELVRLEKFFFESKMKGKLLEYGFGGGCNTAHLYECGYDIFGIDVAKGAFRTTKKRFRNIKKKQKLVLKIIDSKCKKIPYPDNYFDFIVAMSVLSLLGTKQKIQKLLSEFKRVIKPSGKIILDINDHNSQFSKNQKKIRKNVFLTKPVDKYIETYCINSLKEFKNLVKPFFIIKGTGYSAHKLFNRRINEWIICCEKKS